MSFPNYQRYLTAFLHPLPLRPLARFLVSTPRCAPWTLMASEYEQDGPETYPDKNEEHRAISSYFLLYLKPALP